MDFEGCPALGYARLEAENVIVSKSLEEGRVPACRAVREHGQELAVIVLQAADENSSFCGIPITQI
jgi:hypothetical protein